ncbi:MAG: DNA gyrase inhibitor YacG, partial [Candidatus Thiodiazotropha sp. (ex Epidulcina cf. delphinae)]|nr:DNA gyrase inhibitor YacG [Candidatus Thiodiazotropha sp. (ex Epidulcina cf. delphinae)]
MKEKDTIAVPCPACGKPVIWSAASKWRPFCSERCRLIDLGDWLDENHR